MKEVTDQIREEAAARIIEEYQRWLTQFAEADTEKTEEDTESEAIRQIAESKQKIDQIAAELQGKGNQQFGCEKA
jgi:hypothetical protein